MNNIVIYTKLFTYRLAHLLPQHIRFIAIDLPGHGKSSHRWPGIPYVHFEYIADVKKVVSQLGWETFSFIAHSMGAHIASLYAGAFSDEVENLILIDFRLPAEDISKIVQDGHKPADVLARYAIRMSNEKATTPRVYKSLEIAAERRQKATFKNTLRKEDALLLVERGTRRVDDGFVFTHDPILKETCVPFITPPWSITSVLSKVQCAVLVLEGTESKLYEELKDELMEYLDVICKQASFKMWKMVKGGHHVHLENAEQVAQKVKEFLALCTSQEKLQSKL